MSATATSTSIPSASPTADVQTNPNGPSSPLLFFVALGFGVVFTNLWIIVGVKYCFRYNQRNRMRLAGEDPDAVDLNAMPRQRRRREKKLMTIDEVNERFPLVKYKTWRSSREHQGLPAAGGITNDPSRPASMKNVVVDTEAETEKSEKQTSPMLSEKTPAVEHGPAEQTSGASTTVAAPPQTTTSTPIAVPEPALVRATSHDEEVGDQDQIQTAIPPEQLPDPGDTCAICIDTIEDDDDIRGLSCGHAFHASCVDPWLTSRRACCPLCKADYYVPKPRPEVDPNDPRGAGRTSLGQPSPLILVGNGRGTRVGRRGSFLLARIFHATNRPSQGQSGNADQTQPATSSGTPEITTTEANPQTWRSRIHMPSVPALSRIRRGRGNETGEQPAQSPNPTPAQLEAGRT